LVGFALGAIGHFIWGTLQEEDEKKKQEKELNKLRVEVSLKNKEIQNQKLKENLKEKSETSTDSENMLENANLFCPISHGLI